MEHKIISGLCKNLNNRITLPVPFPRSYWVIPGKLLAGFYPGAKDPKEATIKLTALINAGIRHVINLMEHAKRFWNRIHII